MENVQVEIDLPEDVYIEVKSILGMEDCSLSEYVSKLIERDIKIRNIREGLSIQYPKLSIMGWIQKLRKTDRSKYILIDPKRKWPRERH